MDLRATTDLHNYGYEVFLSFTFEEPGHTVSLPFGHIPHIKLKYNKILALRSNKNLA